MKFKYLGSPGEPWEKGDSITQYGYTFKHGEFVDIEDENTKTINKLVGHPHFEHQGELPKQSPVQRVVIVGAEELEPTTTTLHEYPQEVKKDPLKTEVKYGDDDSSTRKADAGKTSGVGSGRDGKR